MRRRCVPVFSVVAIGLALAGASLPCRAAEPRAEYYTGLSLTYTFGGGPSASASSADVSLGAIERSIDLYEQAVSTHVPVLMVPLARKAEPLLMPVSAVVGAVKYLGSRRWLATDPSSPCAADGCADTALSLPDLGAK